MPRGIPNKPREESTAPPAKALPQLQTVRIELLRLVYRHDRTADDAIARATELERFINGMSGKP